MAMAAHRMTRACELRVGVSERLSMYGADKPSNYCGKKERVLMQESYLYKWRTTEPNLKGLLRGAAQ